MASKPCCVPAINVGRFLLIYISLSPVASTRDDFNAEYLHSRTHSWDNYQKSEVSLYAARLDIKLKQLLYIYFHMLELYKNKSVHLRRVQFISHLMRNKGNNSYSLLLLLSHSTEIKPLFALN
jgi:hypothetical protein